MKLKKTHLCLAANTVLILTTSSACIGFNMMIILVTTQENLINLHCKWIFFEDISIILRRDHPSSVRLRSLVCSIGFIGCTWVNDWPQPCVGCGNGRPQQNPASTSVSVIGKEDLQTTQSVVQQYFGSYSTWFELWVASDLLFPSVEKTIIRRFRGTTLYGFLSLTAGRPVHSTIKVNTPVIFFLMCYSLLRVFLSHLFQQCFLQ